MLACRREAANVGRTRAGRREDRSRVQASLRRQRRLHWARLRQPQPNVRATRSLGDVLDMDNQRRPIHALPLPLQLVILWLWRRFGFLPRDAMHPRY